MPKFKLHMRSDRYETAYVEAANKEEALKMAHEDCVTWEYSDTDAAEIIAIDEYDENGVLKDYHYLECDDDGKEKFQDSVAVPEIEKDEL